MPSMPRFRKESTRLRLSLPMVFLFVLFTLVVTHLDSSLLDFQSLCNIWRKMASYDPAIAFPCGHRW
jgi:hypothetical protein